MRAYLTRVMFGPPRTRPRVGPTRRTTAMKREPWTATIPRPTGCSTSSGPSTRVSRRLVATAPRMGAVAVTPRLPTHRRTVSEMSSVRLPEMAEARRMPAPGPDGLSPVFTTRTTTPSIPMPIATMPAPGTRRPPEAETSTLTGPAATEPTVTRAHVTRARPAVTRRSGVPMPAAGSTTPTTCVGRTPAGLKIGPTATVLRVAAARVGHAAGAISPATSLHDSPARTLRATRLVRVAARGDRLVMWVATIRRRVN